MVWAEVLQGGKILRRTLAQAKGKGFGRVEAAIGLSDEKEDFCQGW